MATPSSSASLTQSSSGSTSYHSFSSHRSSLLNTVAGAFRSKRRRGVVVDVSVQDHSHGNKTYNYGQMNVAHGNNIVQNIQNGIDPAEALVLNMRRSRNAEFDMTASGQREPCTPQTCQYILKDLKRWCRQKAAHLLFWLNGMPGTGKTTIVYTMCQYLRRHDLLGASFFCSRSVSDCQDVDLIFPTIAFQLAIKFPVFKQELGNILREDPDIPQRSLNVQLQRLIIDPFEAKKDDLPSDLIVVLDALDECSGKQSSFLQTLVHYTSHLPFRLLLTSRPEWAIDSSLGGKGSISIADKFVLHEVEKSVVREDIVKYIQSKLSPLPDTSVISELADHSGSAFILAATVIRMVTDHVGDTTQRLRSILNSLTSGETSGVTARLDRLYTEILSRVSESYQDFAEEFEGVKNILYTIICTREPLTKQAIGMLWGLNEAEVDGRLKLLRSVIFVPEDSSKAVTVFHASFVDFITDKGRSGSFFCDTAAFHDKLAAMCFKTMNQQLHQNICEVEGFPSNESIDQGTIESRIGLGLAYACVNWPQHLELSDSLTTAQNASAGIEEAREFILSHLFHWLECLSIVGALFVCEEALGTLEKLVKDREIVTLVSETRDFVRLNYDIINYSASEIYRSALVWVPTQSFLRTHHAGLWKRIGLPTALMGLPADWMEASRSVKTHAGGINSLAVTQDSSRVVFGSQDSTVRIWNVISQKEDRVYTGHLASVQCVATSHDGTRIFSASEDQTVRVWDISKPDPITIFRGHSALVQSVAVSRDGMLVSSSDLASNIYVWDPRTAEIMCSMQSAEPMSRNSNVIFMPLNSHLISVSYNIVKIWNTTTGSVIQSFSGHNGAILAIAVSQDAYLLTGSTDRTAKIWTSTGNKVRTLRGHTEEVQTVAFFYDGERAVTGSADKTIRIWSIRKGDTLVLLTGHTQIVWSIAVFPPQKNCPWQIVSGSWDGIMMLWTIPETPSKEKRRMTPWRKKAPQQKEDPWKGRFMASSHTHFCLFLHKKVYLLDSSTLSQNLIINTGKIYSAAFSFQGTRLATATDITTIWDVSTGRKLLSMKGHQSGITCISFSHDDKRMVTGSVDGTARIWCTITGAEQRILRHPQVVYSVAFSPDGGTIATSSENRTSVRLWDSRTGHDLDVQAFGSHFWAESITFSSDGNYLIASDSLRRGTTLVWNIRKGEAECTLEGYTNWTCLSSGICYAIFDSSWICRSASPTEVPTKLCWIPPKYQPIKAAKSWKPTAFASVSEDRILLTNANGIVVLDVSTI